MVPPSDGSESGGRGDGDSSTGAEAAPRKKPLDYERRRFGSKRGRRRDAFEQSTVSWFLSQHPAGQWVLDIPSGTGRLNPQIARCGDRVLSVDRDAGRAASAIQRDDHPSNAAIQGDALSLPFRDDSFDLAVCVRLTHHLDEERLVRLLAELGRVAGEVLVTYYNSSTLTNWRRRLKSRFGGGGHRVVFAYAPARFRELAARAGLRATDRVPRVGLFHHPLQFMRLGR